MKRILSIILCVAMLASMASMTVYGAGELADQVTTENVMTFTTDKDVYKAGDSVTITVSMESIWGDPDLVGDLGDAMMGSAPGAYGMGYLTSTLIYDTSVFTAKKHTDLLAGGGITNGDSDEASVSGNNPVEAKAQGAYNLVAEAAPYNTNYDGYGSFTGSGDLWAYNLTIAADAAPGTYYLPVGPYVITDGKTAGKTPIVKFADDDRMWAWLGNVDSFSEKRDVTYKTNYNGPSLAEASFSYVNASGETVTVEDGTAYECGYIEIIVKGDENPEDVAAAEGVDALIDAIDTVYNAGEATFIDAINYDALYTHTEDTNGAAESGNFSINFKMMPVGYGDGFGFFGGWTEWNGGADVIFWNAAESKFMIGTVNGPVNATEVTSVKAESAVMDLPDNKWTEVEFIYNGSYMGVKVNGELVCETNEASTDYSFYIFYPSDVQMYVKDMDINGYDYDAFLNGANVNAYALVTLDSGDAITAAREAYNALNANAQSFVTKLAVLEAAEAEYKAIAAYDDQVAANKAIALIDAIGTVAYPASGDAIVAAENYVATLTETQLALVTNYDVLTAARAEYDRREGLFNQAKADYVIDLISKIGEVTFESRDAIETAEAEYALLNDAQKALVSNYDVLVAAREAYDMYAPIMNAENLITALGTELYQGKVTHFDAANMDNKGYYNFPDRDTDNCWWGFNLTFDFMYVDANKTEKGSNIGVIRNGDSFAGYDFKTKSFVIGAGGGWFNGSNGPCDFVAQAEYDLLPNRWYNMTIDYAEGTGVASVYLDGELMVTATPADTEYDYAMFYPQQVDMYIGDNTITFGATYPNPFNTSPLTDASAFSFPGAGADAGYYKAYTGIDVLSPVDFGAKIEAAEEAVAALTEEQAALLAPSYTEALATIKAAYEPLYAELVAAADEVEAKIDAMTDAASITAAGEAYKALLPGAQSLVENYADLELALANLVSEQIAALGTITPASADAIAAAEAAYAAMTNEQKALVANYETLVAARKELNDLNAAIKAAEGAIDMLQAGTSNVLKNVADNYSVGSYSQILDRPENISGGSNNHAPYTFAMDVYVESVNAQTATVTLDDGSTVDVDVAYIGWASGNSVFAAYDLVNNKFVVANNGAFKGNYAETLAGLNTVYGEADYEIALNTWYNLKFVVEADYVEIFVDGESVLKVAVDVNGYNIFYPVNNVAYYDNYQFSYNYGVDTEAVSNFSGIDTDTWVAKDSRAWSVVSAPVAGDIKVDADLIAAARAAYDAIPAKAQYAVANYDILVAAEEAAKEPEVPVAPNTDITGLTAIGGVETIDVSWDAVDGAVKYWIYINGKVVASTTDTSITLVAKNAGDYAISVSAAAKDSAGTIYYGAVSEAVVATVEAKPAPELVVSATATENSITAEWNAIEGAAAYYVTFNVGGTDIIVSTTATTITLANYVTADTAYTVSVQAIIIDANNVYTIVDSNVVEGVTAEQSFKVDTADGINWTAIDGATIYWVEITTPSGKVHTYRLGGDITSYDMSGYTASGDYTVVVTAYANGKFVKTVPATYVMA